MNDLTGNSNPGPASPATTDPSDLDLILQAIHHDPFGVLGLHTLPSGGYVLRVFRPGASSVKVIKTDQPGEGLELTRIHTEGFFEIVLPDAGSAFSYRLVFRYDDGTETEPAADPYSFGTVLGEQDCYYFSEGTHQRAYDVLGAHLKTVDGVTGTAFAVWAPNARRVSVVGDFNNWDGRVNPMRKRVESGIWEIFLPGVNSGHHYKFELVGTHGNLFNKADPFAFFSQHGPSTASITWSLEEYEWGDSDWMERRKTHDLYHKPVSFYEAHLGSWARVPEEGDRFLTYQEMADKLVRYVSEMGYTHLELMPVSEFPFDGSWGYQVGGYFAPTSRFGTPDEFRYLVDKCHQAGIGVVLDWVPAHFPKDPHGLARFDGTGLYEHEDPRRGEHQDWGTLIFNYGRNEVRNFLISNALFWLEKYHIDGLRVDAVASMLYLDYSRKEGQWLPNQHGGRENLEAIHFLRELNRVCYETHPGIMMIAEESTAFGGVSRPVDQGGLGFGFKWNMGWMHDFLQYVSRDPIHRRFHHNEATFSMIYAYHENFVLVLSHDEVVHGKSSMFGKMPGDRWQKFANLRMFYAWMFGHPGKKLLFQGNDLAQIPEWNHNYSVEWHLEDQPDHGGVQKLVRDLNHAYVNEPALHDLDHESGGFEWVDHLDSANSFFAFLRKSRGGDSVLVLINATPIPRLGHRVGVPEMGYYREIVNSDSQIYGGSNIGNMGGVHAENIPWNGRPCSIKVKLPPLAAVFFKLER